MSRLALPKLGTRFYWYICLMMRLYVFVVTLGYGQWWHKHHQIVTVLPNYSIYINLLGFLRSLQEPYFHGVKLDKMSVFLFPNRLEVTREGHMQSAGHSINLIFSHTFGHWKKIDWWTILYCMSVILKIHKKLVIYDFYIPKQHFERNLLKGSRIINYPHIGNSKLQ